MKKRITFLILILSLAIVAICMVACGKDEDNDDNSEIKYTVTYGTDGNGTLQGETVQELESGIYTTAVTAVPNEGYKFVKWSDNNYEITRTDKVNEQDLNFTAIFEKLKFTVKYTTSMDAGYISGEDVQIVEYGGSTKEVTLILLLGSRFLGWSDNGSTELIRFDTNITEDKTITALVERIRTDVQIINYTTDGNGTIEGRTYQQVVYEHSASRVTAIPNDGYEFVQWSDGVTTAERHDLSVTESKTLTAQFKRVYVRYNLDYKLGSPDTDITDFKFYDGNFSEVDFPVPTRELFTFGGWYIGDKQVTDINGKMTIGDELLEREEKEIYAKWTANESYTCKILMVYVTELDAYILRKDETKKDHVTYKMSDFDMQICKTITVQVSNYMNDLMDGLVTFEVDEYFTNVPVGSESITTAHSVNGECSCIFAEDIPELQESDLLGDYRSSLVVFCMNDYDYKYRDSAGVATSKNGSIFLESVYDESLINNDPLERLLDLNYWRWYSIIEPFMHELAHSIEAQYNYDNYHSVIRWAHAQLMYDHIIMNKLFYLDLIEIDGKKVGIPLEFWKWEIAKVTYIATEGGIVTWKYQEVLYGNDAHEVTAIAEYGYEFIGWSDGVLTAQRIDTNIVGDFTVTAIFRKKELNS